MDKIASFLSNAANLHAQVVIQRIHVMNSFSKILRHTAIKGFCFDKVFLGDNNTASTISLTFINLCVLWGVLTLKV